MQIFYNRTTAFYELLSHFPKTGESFENLGPQFCILKSENQHIFCSVIHLISIFLNGQIKNSNTSTTMIFSLILLDLRHSHLPFEITWRIKSSQRNENLTETGQKLIVATVKPKNRISERASTFRIELLDEKVFSLLAICAILLE